MHTSEQANENRCPSGLTAQRPARHRSVLLHTLLALPLLSLTLLFAACEGPQGPQGEGVGDLDPEPPTITMISPARGDTIYTTRFDVSASASDNEGVAYVDFYLDGSNQMGSVTARDSITPYEWTWDFDSTGHGYGLYPLIARAVDLSDNVADTAPILISYQAPPLEQTLYYFGNSTTLTYMTMPDKFGDRWFNVRFSPLGSCVLQEIHVELIDPTTSDVFFLAFGDEEAEPVLGPSDIMLYAWNSGDDYYPDGAPLDSLLIAEADAVYSPDWLVTDVSGWGLSFTGDFHAGFSVPGAQSYAQLVNDQQAMAIICHVDPNEYPSGQEYLHRSQEWDPDLGFGSMQDHWSSKLDFHIRAKVLYPDGTSGTLTPVGGPTEVDPVSVRPGR